MLPAFHHLQYIICLQTDESLPKYSDKNLVSIVKCYFPLGIIIVFNIRLEPYIHTVEFNILIYFTYLGNTNIFSGAKLIKHIKD